MPPKRRLPKDQSLAFNQTPSTQDPRPPKRHQSAQNSPSRHASMESTDPSEMKESSSTPRQERPARMGSSRTTPLRSSQTSQSPVPTSSMVTQHISMTPRHGFQREDSAKTSTEDEEVSSTRRRMDNVKLDSPRQSRFQTNDITLPQVDDGSGTNSRAATGNPANLESTSNKANTVTSTTQESNNIWGDLSEAEIRRQINLLNALERKREETKPSGNQGSQAASQHPSQASPRRAGTSLQLTGFAPRSEEINASIGHPGSIRWFANQDITPVTDVTSTRHTIPRSSTETEDMVRPRRRDAFVYRRGDLESLLPQSSSSLSTQETRTVPIPTATRSPFESRTVPPTESLYQSPVAPPADQPPQPPRRHRTKACARLEIGRGIPNKNKKSSDEMSALRQQSNTKTQERTSTQKAPVIPRTRTYIAQADSTFRWSESKGYVECRMPMAYFMNNPNTKAQSTTDPFFKAFPADPTNYGSLREGGAVAARAMDMRYRSPTPEIRLEENTSEIKWGKKRLVAEQEEVVSPKKRKNVDLDRHWYLQYSTGVDMYEGLGRSLAEQRAIHAISAPTGGTTADLQVREALSQMRTSEGMQKLFDSYISRDTTKRTIKSEEKDKEEKGKDKKGKEPSWDTDSDMDEREFD